MKTNALPSIMIVIVSIVILHVVSMLHDELTIERAMKPINYLSDARHLIVNGEYNRAADELEEAMMEMRIIEQYADSSSVGHIEQAIDDLQLVDNEIRGDSLVIADLNRAFFNALNSIAHACMIISENNLDKGEKYAAMRFMNATFAEMVASLKFVSSEDMKVKEEKVISHVREILYNMKSSGYTYKFDYDVINHELEELIEN